MNNQQILIYYYNYLIIEKSNIFNHKNQNNQKIRVKFFLCKLDFILNYVCKTIFYELLFFSFKIYFFSFLIIFLRINFFKKINIK